MVTFVKGDIFIAPAQVLTNTVKCVGVIGKGIALEFKNCYPQMFNDNKARCDQGNVKPGQLAGSYAQMGIQSIAMPALGCGLGGLKWSEVQPLIVKHLGALPDLDVYVYEPQGAAAIRITTEGRESGTQISDEKISARQREL